MMMEIIMPSMEITSLTPYQSCFVLGDSNGDETSRRIIPPIYHGRKQDDPAELNIGARTIHPSMSLVVDG